MTADFFDNQLRLGLTETVVNTTIKDPTFAEATTNDVVVEMAEVGVAMASIFDGFTFQ